jgi:ribosomal protein S18 acetylase RimI-like enzyme
VDPDITRCRAFLDGVSDRLAARLEPFPHGVALLDDARPQVWDLNWLRVERPGAASELAAEAEAVHAAAGHAHRKLLVWEEELGEELRPGFEALGWECEAHVLMVERRAPDRAADTSAVREVSEEELRPAREHSLRGEAWASAAPDAVAQLLEMQLLHDRAVETRRFAAFVDGEIGSFCDLYSDGGVAQVESVVTLPEYRNRGLARAVVTAAAREARAAGADLVFLVAVEEDWPRLLYAKLGFDVAGRFHWFLQRPEARLEAAIRSLLDATGASRVTLRQGVEGAFFPVTHEALGPGAGSIRDGAGIDLRGQPVARVLEETGAQVVQDDCATAFADPAFHRMREAYGGLASQIVTPVLRDGTLVAIVSLHQCGRPRTWTPEEIALASETAERVGAILRA